jgi:hypothetical protein
LGGGGEGIMMRTYAKDAEEDVCGDVLFSLTHCWVSVNDEVTEGCALVMINLRGSAAAVVDC